MIRIEPQKESPPRHCSNEIRLGLSTVRCCELPLLAHVSCNISASPCTIGDLARMLFYRRVHHTGPGMPRGERETSGMYCLLYVYYAFRFILLSFSIFNMRAARSVVASGAEHIHPWRDIAGLLHTVFGDAILALATRPTQRFGALDAVHVRAVALATRFGKISCEGQWTVFNPVCFRKLGCRPAPQTLHVPVVLKARTRAW